MKYSGQVYCNKCKQIVDTESEDNKNFYCVHCDSIFNKNGIESKNYYINLQGEICCRFCGKLLCWTDCYEVMYCDNNICTNFDKDIIIDEHIGKEGIINLGQ